MSEVADPLGRHRCANCLYDRRGLPPDSLCPECGYRLPAGMTVFTLFRQPARPSLVALNLLALTVLLALTLFTSRRAIVDSLLPLGLFLLALVPAAVGALRHAASEHSRAVQLWITDRGIGLERDADRYSFGRRVARAATPVLGFGPIVAAFLLNLGQLSRRTPFWFVAIAVAGGFAVWIGRRRRRLPAVDAVSPPMYPWAGVSAVVAAGERGLTLAVEPASFWVVPRAIEVVGDAAARSIIESAMAAHRQSEPARPATGDE